MRGTWQPLRAVVAACALAAAAAVVPILTPSPPAGAASDIAPEAVPDQAMPAGRPASGAAVDLEPAAADDDDVPVGTVVHPVTATPERVRDADGTGSAATAGDLRRIVDGAVASRRGDLPPPAAGQLAATGVTYVDQMLAVGGLLVLLGVGALVFSRRRRTPDQ